jgi:DNA-binding transcriptional LysR family regulator
MQKDSIKRIKGLSQSGFGVRLLDIKLFTLAARYKNLTLASKKIHLSQSAASASIKKLESALGINLCCHKRSEFELTREGLHLLPILEQWLKDFDRIISGAENMPFRIATTHALATIVSTVSVDRPELELGLLRPDFAYESVILDRADIAIVLDNRSWSNLDSFELYSGEFGL